MKPPLSRNEASNQTTCIKYLPSGTGSIHNLPRSLGTLSACASLWACFSSLLSLANALWVMAARCKEPSGFCVTRITRHVYGLMQNEELENSKLCSPSLWFSVIFTEFCCYNACDSFCLVCIYIYIGLTACCNCCNPFSYSILHLSRLKV